MLVTSKDPVEILRKYESSIQSFFSVTFSALRAELDNYSGPIIIPSKDSKDKSTTPSQPDPSDAGDDVGDSPAM